MPEGTGTLESLAGAIADCFSPLGQLDDSNVRAVADELGLTLSPAVLASPAFGSALTTIAQAARQLPDAWNRLFDAADAGDTAKILSQGATLLGAVVRTLDGIKTLDASVPGFAGQMLDYLVVRYLEAATPATTNVLVLFGLLDRRHLPAAGGKPPIVKRAVHLERIGSLLKDPEAYFKDMFDWGKPGFDGSALFERLSDALVDVPYPITPDLVGGLPALKSLLFDLSVLPAAGSSKPGVALDVHLPVAGGLALDFPLGVPGWSMHVTTEAELGVGTRIAFRPPNDVSVKPPAGTISGKLLGELVVGPVAPATDVELLSIVGGTRLAAQGFRGGVGLKAQWDSASGQAKAEPVLSFAVEGGTLHIDVSGGDGFLKSITSSFALDAEFELGVTWSLSGGVEFQGSASLAIEVPTHIALGPIELTSIYLSVGLADDGAPIELSTTVKAALGPLQAVVQRIGALGKLSFPAGRDGNLGPLQLDVTFKPPTGVGLSIDVGVVKGGGFLSIDPDRGEYAGAIELALFEIVTIKAIGLISTKMPDGSNGFSLLVIMSVEFGAGIQLGFGFTLLAVGGLLGLNRTMNLQALAEGIRSGAIESVMFPKDIIANAPKIISDLKSFFPVRVDTFLIGPMVKLGWGTPTLVSLSLGIILEIPGNIAIVGVLQVALPTADAALIKLQVNFIGAIEFDKKRVWFFAALFDSRVLFLTIEGEMGLLVAFGDDANFVVSVGGFHPRFTPPPLPFPSPRRIRVSILNTSFARIGVEGYFAVTSNTVQFGARVELFFGLDILNVDGHLAFDALFQFSPFYFVIEISASLSVNVFGAGLFSVSIHGLLEGPAPWHIQGHGSITILFWDVGVDFEHTWGENKKQELPPVPVLPLLVAELDKADNWRAALPTGSSLLVSLRKMSTDEAALILHPVGVLRISQRALPLDLKLDKVGSQKPSDVSQLTLQVTGGGLAKKADAFEQFAPAQFQDFADDRKLSAPAFAKEHSGVELSAAGNDLQSSTMLRRIVRYEEIILDSNFKRFARRLRGYVGSLFSFFLKGGAAARSELSQESRSKYQPFAEKIQVADETYSVVFQADNRALSPETASFHSEASARGYLEQKIAEDPALAETLHVIPSYEKAA